ncbi:MAG: N-acetylmuramoyl-L-alanine amidase [Blastocatellia bacterium]
MSSRDLARDLVWWISLCALACGLLVSPAKAQEASFKPNVRRSEIRFDFKENFPQSVFTSQPIKVPMEAPEPFLAVGAVWNADERVTVGLRGSIDGSRWSDWREFHTDHDSMTQPGEYIAGLMLMDARTKFVQFRIVVEKSASGFSPALTGLRLNFISPGATPKQFQERMLEKARGTMSASSQPPSTKYPKPPVVTRTEWGCPDGQGTTHGSLSYTTVTHLIVHHTVNDNNATDWPAVVRSIWNFHIFTNGWADIGYNYLIDPNGVIYEGRSGGDNVLGAHFSGVNAGTMGVAMLGTFTEVAPAAKALNSLKKILAWKADQRNLDPTGTSLHAASQRNLNTISGHRDGPGSTECPGDSFYPLLPAIRTEVNNLLSSAGAVAGVSAASFKPSALASESIVALFGTSLAASTQSVASAPLPVSLGGTSVTVRDSANNEKLAPLFFVSQGQINFLMPAGLANGAVTIIATNHEGRVARGTVNIAPVAPALFSANADGRGVAAALVLRVKAGGSQSYEPVARFDQSQNRFVAAPIDLGVESDQVFLVAYGTGIRFRASLGGVAARIGGLDSQVLFAGAAAGFFGLDQVNVRLSRSLIGRGEVDFELTVDGQAANALKLWVK